MTVAPQVVAALTEGEPNLDHFLDLLRERGVHVLATARPHEAALFVARHPVTCLILRSAALQGPIEDFLRPLRDFDLDPFVLVIVPPDGIPPHPSPLVDRYQAEPFRYSTLLETLGYRVERRHAAGTSPPRSRSSPRAWPAPTP